MRGRVALNGAITGAFESPTTTFNVTATDLNWSAIANGRSRPQANSLQARSSSTRARCVLMGWRSTAGRASRLLTTPRQVSSSVSWSTPGLRAFASLVDLAPTKLRLLPASGTVNLTWARAIPALASLAGDLHVDIREPGAGPLTLKGRDGRWELTYQHRLAGETRADLHLETSLQATEWLQSPLHGSLDIHSENVAAAIRQVRGAAILMPSEFDAVTAGRVAARGWSAARSANLP